jgi:hypothetical protein
VADDKTPEVIRQRGARISSVMNHPGWEEHVDEAKRKIEILRHTAARVALAEEGADQRKLDEIRGWIAALKWTYKMPEAAERKHERWIEEELEAIDE